MQTEGIGEVVIVASCDSPNLKITLKNIIRGAITNTDGNDGYKDFLANRTVMILDSPHIMILNSEQGSKLLPYDLDLLREHVQRKRMQKLVVAFRDSEAFDHNLLADLISLL